MMVVNRTSLATDDRYNTDYSCVDYCRLQGMLIENNSFTTAKPFDTNHLRMLPSNSELCQNDSIYLNIKSNSQLKIDWYFNNVYVSSGDKLPYKGAGAYKAEVATQGGAACAFAASVTGTYTAKPAPVITLLSTNLRQCVQCNELKVELTDCADRAKITWYDINDRYIKEEVLHDCQYNAASSYVACES